MDWTQRSGLQFCPPHIALIVHTLLEERSDVRGNISDDEIVDQALVLSVEAMLGITAVTEILCHLLLASAREHMQTQADNGGATNYIMPCDIAAARDAQRHHWRRAEHVLPPEQEQESGLRQRQDTDTDKDTDKEDMQADMTITGIGGSTTVCLDLRSVFPGHILSSVPCCGCGSSCCCESLSHSAHPSQGSIPQKDDEDARWSGSADSPCSQRASNETKQSNALCCTYAETLRTMTSQASAGVIISPLTGHYLQAQLVTMRLGDTITVF